MSRGELPIATPGKVICVGLNYRDHAEESGAPVPSFPVLFGKWVSSLIPHDAPIIIPSGVEQVDFEAELAVVIGRAGRDISEADALDFVAGYACFNDVSSRADQALDGQWTRGKSYDSFGPIGPRLVPTSEIDDPQSLAIRCRVDGVTVQESNTSNMIFSVAQLIEAVSRATTLAAGDVIATGTPGGVGLGRTPQLWLVHGSVVEVEIDGIGTLRNHVVAHNHSVTRKTT